MREKSIGSFREEVLRCLALSADYLVVHPGSAKNAMAHVLETPDGPLRLIGVASAVLGVVLVWLVRG